MITVTSLLAVYGAVLSTLLAVVAIIEARRNSPRLKVYFDGPRVSFSTKGVLPNDPACYIAAANVHKSPVTITGLGFKLPGKKDLEIEIGPNPASVPFELLEGRPWQHPIDAKDLIDGCRDHSVSQLIPYVRIATGTVFFGKPLDIAKFEKDFTDSKGWIAESMAKHASAGNHS